MKTRITLHSDTCDLPPWRAIVRGQIALHTTPIHKGTALEHQAGRLVWTVTHIPTGLAIVRVVGACGARKALRELARLDFSTRDQRLIKRVKRAIEDLDARGVQFAGLRKPRIKGYNAEAFHEGA